MTTRLIDGGPASSEDVYIGPSREVRYDTSNHELRLHDGALPGGHKVLNRDANDQRYHPSSVELLGLDKFASLAVGLVTRIAPGEYRLRALGVDDSALEINDGFGVDGDLVISLLSVISGARTFTGVITGAAGFVGGLTGNVTGNVAGNVTGNLTGNVTGDLTGNTTGSHTGNVNVSGGILQLAAEQVPVAAIDQSELIALIKLHSDPSKSIKMFYGTIAEVPVGWFVCDGTNGTPDLRNLVPMGTATDGEVGQIGGSSTHSHTAGSSVVADHSHAITVEGHAITLDQMAHHAHSNGIVAENTFVHNRGALAASPTMPDSVSMDNNDGVFEGITSYAGAGEPHSHGSSSAAAGSHSHVVSVDVTNTLPPHRKLLFIMKG